MEKFKYYRRGTGELDTSNFPDILESGRILIDNLDARAFVSLLAFKNYAQNTLNRKHQYFTLYVRGYVEHLRGDKDEFQVSNLYRDYLRPMFKIVVQQPQHEDTSAIQGGLVFRDTIRKDLRISPRNEIVLIGADSSVERFCPEVDYSFSKVRKNGKVVKVTPPAGFPEVFPESSTLVIVDDILGGGATIQQVVDTKSVLEHHGDIGLWVAANEGIHSSKLILHFDKTYIGKTVTQYPAE